MAKINKDNKTQSDNNFYLPSSVDIEKDLLSCIISASNEDPIEEIIAELKEEDFYDADTKAIFVACRELIENKGNEYIDLTLLKDELMKNNKADLSEILSDIISFNKSFVEAKNYKDKLINYSYLRNIIFSLRKILKESEAVPSYTKLLALYESELNRLIGYRSLEDNLKHISDATASFINQRTEELRESKRYVLPTGLKTLDEMLNEGFKPGQLAIIAARPGCGKTAFALNIISNTIKKYKDLENTTNKPVIVLFNQEMSKEELVQRIISNVRTVELSKLNKATTTDSVIKHEILTANKMFQNTNIYIDDTAGILPEQISAKCKNIKRKHQRLDLVIVDYLQLLKSKEKTQSRQYEVAEISRAMKLLAKELKVPVLVLSQLSRDIEKREDIKGVNKQPKLSDLRDSGAIEQDADIVIFLHKPSEKAEEANQKTKDITLTLAKHRNGSQGYLSLLFEGNYMRFTEKNKLDQEAIANEINKVSSADIKTQQEEVNKQIKETSQNLKMEKMHEDELLEQYNSQSNNSFFEDYEEDMENSEDLGIDDEKNEE